MRFTQHHFHATLSQYSIVETTDEQEALGFAMVKPVFYPVLPDQFAITRAWGFADTLLGLTVDGRGGSIAAWELGLITMDARFEAFQFSDVEEFGDVVPANPVFTSHGARVITTTLDTGDPPFDVKSNRVVKSDERLWAFGIVRGVTALGDPQYISRQLNLVVSVVVGRLLIKS